MAQLEPCFASIDRTAVHRHPRVITEETCAKKKVFVKDEEYAQGAMAQHQVYNTSAPAPLYNPSTRSAAPQPSQSYGQQPQTMHAQPNASSYNQAPASSSPAGRPLPTPGGSRPMPLPPRPQSAPQAKALYPFEAQSPQELGFEPGDVLTITNKNGDWWEAELRGRRGLIPANYVQLI